MHQLQIGLILSLAFSLGAIAAEPAAPSSAGPVAAAAAPAPACGDRLRGFSVFDVWENDELKERYGVHGILDWSDASAFQGIAVRSGDEKLQLEIDLRKNPKGKPQIQGSYEFKAWEKDKSYFAADGFNGEKFFKNADDGHTFILRLKDGDKVVCEDSPRRVNGD